MTDINLSKQQLGQFYTTNFQYILQELSIPDDCGQIIEPFAGAGHLTAFAKTKAKTNSMIEYDIAPKNDSVVQRDTLMDPPIYANHYIITNPPYLARNKCADKTVFDSYGENDLYKCFIRNIITNCCMGGIIIIPLNFFCSIRKSDIRLRCEFMEVYTIDTVRIFEEQVFDDTAYTVCVVQFIKNPTKKIMNTQTINVEFYPERKSNQMKLGYANLYTFGGEIHCLPTNKKIKIERLTRNNLPRKNSRILLKCIDDGEHSQLGLSYEEDDTKLFIDNTLNLSARAYATLIIEPTLSDDEQKNIVERFNKYMAEQRLKFHSLFLTNYRESKNGFARKRIAMSHAYDIVNNLIE